VNERVLSNWCQGCQVIYLLVAFFFGFVFLDLFVFVAALVPLEALDPFKPFADLEPLVVAATLVPFIAETDSVPFEIETNFAPFGTGALEEFVLREAKNSSTEAYPVAAKIRLIVGESSLI